MQPSKRIWFNSCFAEDVDAKTMVSAALRCIRNIKKQQKKATQAVQKCQSELNNRNTIKKNVATSSNRINKFLLVTVVVLLVAAEETDTKKCFFRLNKIISIFFHFVISLKAFVDDDCGTWSECTKRLDETTAHKPAKCLTIPVGLFFFSLSSVSCESF